MMLGLANCSYSTICTGVSDTAGSTWITSRLGGAIAQAPRAPHVFKSRNLNTEHSVRQHE